MNPVAFECQPNDPELPEARAWALMFLKIPGATLTLADWERLTPVQRAGFVQAGAEVEAERLTKLNMVIRGELGEAISEYDGGTLAATQRLVRGVDAVVERLSGHRAG